MNNKKKISLIIGITIFGMMNLNYVFAKTGVVTTETLRIRASASTSAKIVDMANQGEKLEILDEENDWYKIKYKGIEGYTSKTYLKVDGEDSVNTSATPAQTPTNVEPETTTEPINSIAPSETPEQTSVQTPYVEPTPSPEETVIPDSQVEMKLGSITNRKTDAYLTPSFSSIKISKISEKKSVNVLKTIGNWSKVTIDSNEAWIPNSVLMVAVGDTSVAEHSTEATTEPEKVSNDDTKDTETQVQPTTKLAYISSNSAANMRSGPSTSNETIQSLPHHTVITIISEENTNWYKITYNGKEGYVSKDLVTIGEPSTDISSRAGEITKQQEILSPVAITNIENQIESSETSVIPTGNIVSVAQNYLGSRYVSGGASPSSGFDCSGFTQYVYGQCGVSISRSSYTQANDGVAVSKSDIQPGDLLLFSYYGNSSVEHVGIYVGNGQFIHAANSQRGVVYDSIESGYYAQNYLGARRVQ